jgi:hypothetical protein
VKSQIITVVLLALTTGCVTYRDFPTDVEASKVHHDDNSVAVRITGRSLAGGSDALKQRIKHNSPFKEVVFVDEPQDQGLFIDVDIDPINPSIWAMGFGYLSVATLTILPAWSTQDGNYVTFNVYDNGERVESNEYEVRRGVFVWILMLPLAWVNLATPSEAGAFEAITDQFFLDFQNSELQRSTARVSALQPDSTP